MALNTKNDGGLSLAERWDKVWSYVRGRPSEVKRAIVIPPDRVHNSGEMPKQFDPKKHYFAVVINEMFLTTAREWWTEYDPMALVVSEFSYGGQRKTVPFVVGPSMIPTEPQNVPGGVAITDTLVAGLHPYTGGKFALTVILAQVKKRSHAADLLQIVDKVAHAFPAGSALEPHLKVASAVMEGVDAMFGLTDTRPLVGQRWEYNDGVSPWLQPGFFALIDADESTVKRDQLSVVGGRLYKNMPGASASGYRDSPFVLYSLRILERRSDVDELPFYQLYSTARKVAASAEEGSWDRAKAALVTLYQEMLLSPDLTFSQAQQLAAEFKAELVEINEGKKNLILGDPQSSPAATNLDLAPTGSEERLSELRSIHSLLKL